MNREIKWTKTARQTYLEILLSIQERWGDDMAIKLNDRLEKVLPSIQDMPFMFPAVSENTTVRRCVLTKQTSLFYQVFEDSIHLLTFFDNRQNPDRLTLPQ